VEAARDGAEFWLNKVRTSTKSAENAAAHQAFATGVKNLYNALYAYVKAEFKMGMKWNPRGVELGDAPAAAAAPAPAPAPAAASPAANKGGLFAELKSIDQSSGRTAGLRHVTKDMKSKAGGAAAAPVKRATASTGANARGGAGKASAAPSKPPRKELVGKRWMVENYVDGGVVTISDVAKQHEVYIYNCVNTTIVIEGKCNALQVDKAVRSQIVFDAAVATAGLVDCKRVKIQVKDRVPSISIDKTDGAVVYLSYASRATELVTSKSSEINVSFPVSDAEDAEWVEQPIPEQFVAVLTPEGKVDVRVSDLYSA
jgi:adenylyl cyclase-associated protein